MARLSAREAYRRWAPAYGKSAVTQLDQLLAAAMSPPARGKRLLDAGCGTGLRLAGLDTALAIGIDASPEMLAAGKVPGAAADVRALPFADACFDLVWCRLVLGYIADPAPVYRELARVCRAGGHVFVSDFHPHAIVAGHRRSFRDATGSVHEIENHAHDAACHLRAAASAGLELVEAREAAVGPQIESFYASAGRVDMYERDRGLNLVAAFLFVRPDRCAV